MISRNCSGRLNSGVQEKQKRQLICLLNCRYMLIVTEAGKNVSHNNYQDALLNFSQINNFSYLNSYLAYAKILHFKIVLILLMFFKGMDNG